MQPKYRCAQGAARGYAEGNTFSIYLSMKTTPTSQAARPNGPMYISDFLATGAALNQGR